MRDEKSRIQLRGVTRLAAATEINFKSVDSSAASSLPDRRLSSQTTDVRCVR